MKELDLPSSVREIAGVIGRERALYLIGQLPRCVVKDSRSASNLIRVILYVPKMLRPDHRLVQILGWHDAQRLVNAFGGEILCPPTLHGTVYKPHRDAAIRRLNDDGVPVSMVAEWFGMTERRVRQVLEITQEGGREAANDNPDQ